MRSNLLLNFSKMIELLHALCNQTLFTFLIDFLGKIRVGYDEILTILLLIFENKLRQFMTSHLTKLLQ